jgi:FtsZ-interacting cell division protein ZipA
MIALIVRGLWSLKSPSEKLQKRNGKSEEESTETDNPISGSDDCQGKASSCNDKDKEGSSEK